jgi:four helix bundle protein
VGVRHLEQLRAWQAAREFKLEIYKVVGESARARADVRFSAQLTDAAASGEVNIAEGFRRFSAGDFSVFLGYAAASMEEALSWIRDGVDREYFQASRCDQVFLVGKRAIATSLALKKSLRPFLGPSRKPPRHRRRR